MSKTTIPCDSGDGTDLVLSPRRPEDHYILLELTTPADQDPETCFIIRKRATAITIISTLLDMLEDNILEE